MLTPDDAHEATHLLRAMQDLGVNVQISRGDGFVVVNAVDANGEVIQVRRDDVNLLAAVVETAEMLGWDFG